MCFGDSERQWLCCGRASRTDDTKYISSDNEIIVIERRYGFYRLGVFIAIIIVLLLILGTIPVTLILKNNQIVLICLCSTLLAVAILLSVFCVWQHEQVKRQRARSSLPYIIHRQHKNGIYTAVPTTSAARSSWLFWQQSNKNDYTDHPLRSPSIQHNPTKISTLQEVSEAPQYTTVV